MQSVMEGHVLELAAAVKANFVRGTFCGVYVGDGGFYNNDFSALLRRKAALPLDELKMLYFINPESDQSLDTRPLADIAKTTIAKLRQMDYVFRQMLQDKMWMML